MKKITVPSTLFRLWPVFATGLLIFIFSLSFSSIYFYLGHQEKNQAKLNLSKLKIEMAQVNAHLNDLEENLERLSSFDHKLRIMTNLRDPERQLAMGPLAKENDAFQSSDSPFDNILPYLNLDATSLTSEELLVRVRKLQAQSANRENSMASLMSQLRNRETLLAATPATWPLNGYLSSKFGMRISPFTGVPKFHAGIDIAAGPGSPVHAPGNGKVAFVGQKPGYGYTLIINHGYGIVTCYAHNSEVTVKKGQVVKRGDLIARVGNTGRSTGPHLHYEVRLNGKAKDPRTFILNE